MKVTEVRFRMNVEVGSYKHEHVEVAVELGPKDTAEKAYAFARKQAHKLIGVDVSDEDIRKAKAVLAKAARRRNSSDADGTGDFYDDDRTVY